MTRPPTSKLLLIGLVVAALAVIGIVLYTHQPSKDIVPEPVVSTVPVAGEWPSTKIDEKTIVDDKSYYTITAAYPIVKDSVISQYFKDFIDDNIKQFKEDTAWAEGDGADIAPAEASSLSLNISYTQEKSSNADNYVFSIATYTGGAHGLSATKTFSFSPTGQVINLSSLFTNQDKGLKAVAAYVQQELKSRPNADLTAIEAGTEARAENFQNFVVTDKGITFTFDPYQVAPYSAGTVTVSVPASAFKSVASKDIFTL
ncbi:MAG: DUF3298 domain-containing protein [Patescibacteria group bacterium]